MPRHNATPATIWTSENEELLESANSSHERFVKALCEKDEMLAGIAYRNYVRALALILEEVEEIPPTSDGGN